MWKIIQIISILNQMIIKNKKKSNAKELENEANNEVNLKEQDDLDKALYQMGEAKNKPTDKPLMKEMLNDLEKGKPLTKETAIKALTEMKDSKDKLDTFILQREKELNNKNALEIAIKKKEKYATNINDRIKYINENIPSFKNNEVKVLNRAKDTIKKYEQEKSKQIKKNLSTGFMSMDRGR